MPFGGGRPNYQKLRTNLRLCINRLKLLEKKKTELALKSRKEIADYITAGKDDRARIRVEHIIREDYMVEGMEIVEMFCDLLLARFGVIDKMKEMDPGLQEPIATILWAAPRLMSDVPELMQVAKQLGIKYGKEFHEACKTNTLGYANEKVLIRMGVAAPPKKLVEQYMSEIAKSFNVPFEPDPSAIQDDIPEVLNLVDLDPDPRPPGFNGGRGGGSGGGGGLPAGMIDTMPGMPAQNPMFMPPVAPMPGGYPNQYDGYNPGFHAPVFTPPAQYNAPSGQNVYQPAPGIPHSGPPPHGGLPRLPSYDEVLDADSRLPNTHIGGGSQENFNGYNGTNQSSQVPSVPTNVVSSPPALPSVPANVASNPPALPSVPTNVSSPPALPSVPTNVSSPPALPSVPPVSAANLDPVLPSVPVGSFGVDSSGNDDIDFDDLTKRFEELKRKK